jgi:ABC-type nickel/cobalt efflux system permease component RcnA
LVVTYFVLQCCSTILLVVSLVSTGNISIGNDHEEGHEDKTADWKKNMGANIIGAVLLYLKKSHLRQWKRYQKVLIVCINPCPSAHTHTHPHTYICTYTHTHTHAHTHIHTHK